MDSIDVAGNRHICIKRKKNGYSDYHMDIKDSRIKYLFELYTSKSASSAEIEEFFELTIGDQFNDELRALIQSELSDTEIQEGYDERRWDLVFQKVKQTVLKEDRAIKRQFKRMYKIAFAAAVALIVFGAGLFYFNQQQYVDTAVQYVTDIAPGKQGATLTLANGKKIALSAAGNGALTNEAGVLITKSAEGQLVYEIQGKEILGDNLNTLSTLKGQTYMLVLPDKSKVWLNAASSITYAAKLYGNGAHAKRTVKLSGEAYFEVAKDSDHPFVVESKGQQVEVLGTHFNISSYQDESLLKTTLLEGRVKVVEGSMQKILSPGYQAINSGQTLQLEKVDTELVVAWKNGMFQFYRANVKTVMKQLARWYDVDVEYQGQIPDREFTGKMYRKVNLSEALNILSELDVKFKIQGRKIIVSP